MKALKGTLLFVLGMIVGIIVFVVAIGGAAYALATMTTVGQLQNTIGIDVIDKDSDIAQKSILEVVQEIIDDVQHLDSLTIQTLKDKYGLPIPDEIAGIDITSIFKYPVLKIGEHVTEIVNSVTLNQILGIAGVDPTEQNLPPILTENLDNNVQNALTNIFNAIDADKMTLREIERNFGLSLGANGILDMLKDAPFSTIADTVMTLAIGDLTQIDSDKFIKTGDNKVFVKTAQPYVVVDATEYGKVAPGAKTYVSGSENGKTSFKELRFVKKEITTGDGSASYEYVVDNSSNAAGFAADETTPVYYRYVEYSAYDTEAQYPANTEFFIPAYLNAFVAQTADDGSLYYAEKQAGYISLNTLYTDAAGTNTVNKTVTNATVAVPELVYFTYSPENGSAQITAADAFGVNPEILLSSSAKLEKGYAGYARIYVGKDATAMQALSSLKLNDLNNATDEIMNLKVKDVFDITADSSELMQSMQDKTLKELTNSFDDISISDIMSVSQSAYVEDANGIYAYVNVLSDYVNVEAVEPGETAYYLSFAQNNAGAFVKYLGAFYRYDSSDKRFEGYPRFDKGYSANPDDSADGGKLYRRFDKAGYYTLYNPDTHKNATRYTLADANYSIASKSQIADKTTTLYYWNGTAMTPVDDTTAQTQRLFVQQAPSAKILQRLAYTRISDFSSAVDSLSLGDVTDIAVDVYAQVGVINDRGEISFDVESGIEYFYFDNGIYKSFNPLDQSFVNTIKNKAVYTIKIAGAGNAIMKKLALLSVKDFGSRMDEVIDNLTLGDVIDVTTGAYIKDDSGAYVYVQDGGYYTLYNPAVHGAAQRYSVYSDNEGENYAIASSARIADGTGLYYYDYTLRTMSEYNASVQNPGLLYVQLAPGQTVSSSVLQRFKKCALGDFSSSFDTLSLSDVMNVDADVYVLTARVNATGELKAPDGSAFVLQNKDYYYYDAGLYKIADISDSGFLEAHKDTDIFEVGTFGGGNVILKKLAYIRIDELGAKMNDVINETYLSELVQINENSAVKQDAAGDKYLVSPDVYTTLIKDGDGYASSSAPTAFVLDASGDFMRAKAVFMQASSNQLVKNGTDTYGYAKAIDTTSSQTIITSLMSIDYSLLYFKDVNGDYQRNAAAIAMLIKDGYYDDVYKRVISTDSSVIGGTERAYTKYAKSAKLYVNTIGETYVLYDSQNPAHADLPLYWSYSEGFYPVSELYVQNGTDFVRYNSATDKNREKFIASGNGYVSLESVLQALNDKNVYYYDYAAAAYVTTAGASTQEFVKLNADLNGDYYFAQYVKPADDTKIARYSKRNCETVYSQNAAGKYVYINNRYVSYDAGNPAHDALERYEMLTGYLAAPSEINDGTYNIAAQRVSVVRARSEAPLRAFARHKTTLANLNDVLGSLTVNELMEPHPDSIFAGDDIKNATLSSAGDVFGSKIKSMSFGELISLSGADVNVNVKMLLNDVSLSDFIASLKYDLTAAYPIYIDVYAMLKVSHAQTPYTPVVLS